MTDLVSTGSAVPTGQVGSSLASARVPGWHDDIKLVGCQWYWDGERWDGNFRTVSGLPLPTEPSAVAPDPASATYVPKPGMISAGLLLALAVGFTLASYGFLIPLVPLPIIAFYQANKAADAVYRGDRAEALSRSSRGRAIRWTCYAGMPVLLAVALALGFAVAVIFLELILTGGL